MRLLTRVGMAAATALVIVGAGTAVAGGGQAPPALGPDPVTVVLDFEHSTMQPSALRVRTGTRVRFVVVNNDPINHELILGPAEVHDRHRDGTERRHRPVPGEVSVPALERAVTSYTFESTGTVEMACHLPGHYDYGMRGEVQVVPDM